MTVSAMVLGDAPGYWPLTTTVGGTISGYSLIGRFGIASKPATVIRIARTVAKIGRSMKNEEIFMRSLRRGRRAGHGGRRVGPHVYALRRNRDSRVHPLRAVHDDYIAGLEALAHDAQAVNHAAEFHLAVFDLIVGAEQQHVLLTLIGIHSAIIDQNGRILSAPQELHARKQARRELTVFVLQHRARANGAGLRIQLIVDEIDRSRMGKSLLVGQPDPHGIARVARTWLAAARHLRVSQVALFVGVKININRVHGDDRRKQRAAVGTAGHQIPARHLRAADAPVDGAGHPGKVQIERGGLERRLGAGDVGLGLRDGALAFVQLFLRHGAAVLELLHPLQFDLTQFQRRLEALYVRGGAVVFGLIRPRVNDEEQGATLDQAALREGDLVDVAGHAWADLDRLDCLQPPGKLVPVLDALLQDLRDTDLRRRGRLGSCGLPATG